MVETKKHQRQTFVSKFELGERRLKVAEFVTVAKALGADLYDIFQASEADERRAPKADFGRTLNVRFRPLSDVLHTAITTRNSLFVLLGQSAEPGPKIEPSVLEYGTGMAAEQSCRLLEWAKKVYERAVKLNGGPNRGCARLTSGKLCAVS